MPSKRVRNGRAHWMAQINRKGFRREQVCDSKGGALAWERDMRKLLESGITQSDIKRLLDAGVPPQRIPQVLEEEKTLSVSVLEWGNSYLEFSKQKHASKVFSEKLNTFRRLAKYFDPRLSVGGITPGIALDYLAKQARDRSANAANKDRKNLVAAWNWGTKFRDFPKPNPFQIVDPFRYDESHHYVPPLSDFLKVMDMAEGQDRTLLLTFLHTAGRRSEVYRLKWEDLDFVKQRIRLKTRKTRGGSLREDWVPMSDDLVEALEEHKRASSGEWVFCQVEGRMKGHRLVENRGFPQKLCVRAGVRPFGCHGIRGLTSSILAQHDKPMVVIQQMLRHQNLRTTERYVRGLEPVRPHLAVLPGGKKKEPTEEIYVRFTSNE